MANKRRIIVGSQIEKIDDDHQEHDKATLSDRDLSIVADWRAWLLCVYLKYLFVVGTIFIICLFPLEILGSIKGDFGVALSFLFELVIIPLAIWTYFHLWGDNGRWGGGNPADDSICKY